MNLELYTSEFRDFKYLKSTSLAVKFYKEAYRYVNMVQPWAEINDPNFVWPCRVEFIEQLLDLKDAVYIIRPANIFSSSERFVEKVRFIEVKNPVVYQGHLLRPQEGRRATLEDVSKIEDLSTYTDPNVNFYLCSSDYFDIKDTVSTGHPGNIIRIGELPIVPPPKFSPYGAMFYDKNYARKFANDLLIHIEKYESTVSTIASKF